MRSRDSSRQTRQRSPSATLPHSRQNAMRSFRLDDRSSRALASSAGLHQPEREPLSGLRPDAGQPRQLVDQLLDRALVRHALLRGFRRVDRDLRASISCTAEGLVVARRVLFLDDLKQRRCPDRVSGLPGHARDGGPDPEQIRERLLHRPSSPRYLDSDDYYRGQERLQSLPVERRDGSISSDAPGSLAASIADAPSARYRDVHSCIRRMHLRLHGRLIGDGLDASGHRWLGHRRARRSGRGSATNRVRQTFEALEARSHHARGVRVGLRDRGADEGQLD